MPAARVSGPLMISIWLAAAGMTSTSGLVPVIVLSAESVAVIVWLPAVARATLVNVCEPASAAVKV